MSAQRVPALSARYIVRSEIAPSVCLMLEAAAKQYDDGDPENLELSETMVSLAESVRARESIDLMAHATSHDVENAAVGNRVGDQIIRELRYAFRGIDDDASPDWRYLSDLAAFAADIEAMAACGSL